jgi:hypothetical protein
VRVVGASLSHLYVVCRVVQLSYNNQTKTVCDFKIRKVICTVYGRVTAIDITKFVLYTACDSINTGNYVPALQESETCGAMARIDVTSAAPSSTRKTEYLGLVSPFRLQNHVTGCGQDNGEV